MAPQEENAAFDRTSPAALISLLTTLEAVKEDVYLMHGAEGLAYTTRTRHKNSSSDDTVLSIEDVIASAVPEDSRAIEIGMNLLYLTAVRNAVLQHGTAEGMNALLYFLNALFQNIKKDGVRVSAEVLRELADIAKYYGRTVFARNIVRESSRGCRFERDGRPIRSSRSADVRVFSRYMCTVNPWAKESVNPFIAQLRPAEGGETALRQSASGAIRRYEEARDFLHNSINFAHLPSEEQSNAPEAMSALLWFTRKLLLFREDAEDGDSTNGNEIATACITILRNIDFLNAQMMAKYELPLDPEYVDHMLHLVEHISTRLMENDTECTLELVKIQHGLIEKMREEPSMLFAWAEVV